MISSFVRHRRLRKDARDKGCFRTIKNVSIPENGHVRRHTCA